MVNVLNSPFELISRRQSGRFPGGTTVFFFSENEAHLNERNGPVAQSPWFFTMDEPKMPQTLWNPGVFLDGFSMVGLVFNSISRSKFIGLRFVSTPHATEEFSCKANALAAIICPTLEI